jgi:hypothetical protein
MEIIPHMTLHTKFQFSIILHELGKLIVKSTAGEGSSLSNWMFISSHFSDDSVNTE